MCNKTENKLYRPIKLIGNYWLAGITIILLIFSISIHYKSIEYYDSALMLGFIGILATFIVVGNYAQVMTIRDDSKETIRETKDEISKALEEMRTDFEKRIIIINDENSKLTKTIEDSNNNFETLINYTQLYLEGLTMINSGNNDSVKWGLEMIIKTLEQSLKNKLPSLFVPSLSILNSYQNSSHFDIFINHFEDFKSFKNQFPNNPEFKNENQIIDDILNKIINHLKNQ